MTQGNIKETGTVVRVLRNGGTVPDGDAHPLSFNASTAAGRSRSRFCHSVVRRRFYYTKQYRSQLKSTFGLTPLARQYGAGLISCAARKSDKRASTLVVFVGGITIEVNDAEVSLRVKDNGSVLPLAAFGVFVRVALKSDWIGGHARASA